LRRPLVRIFDAIDDGKEEGKTNGEKRVARDTPNGLSRTPKSQKRKGSKKKCHFSRIQKKSRDDHTLKNKGSSRIGQGINL